MHSHWSQFVPNNDICIIGEDGDVVQVIPVGRSLDKEGVSWMVYSSALDYAGPIVFYFIVTNRV